VPQYAANGVPADAADLTQVADFAAEVGNRKVGTNADRGALTGDTLWPGLAFGETDTGREFISPDGTTWTPVSPGLVIVVPGSVAGGTLSPAGKVTFTNAASVTVGAAFLTAYDNYVIHLDVTSSSAAHAVQLRLTAAGVATTTHYYAEVIYANVNSVAGVEQDNLAYWTINAGTGLAHKTRFEVSQPALSAPTMFNSSGSDFSNLTGGPLVRGEVGGYQADATAFDGFNITASAGTMTGMLRVYGYTNG
jgi:hypothetical protein